MASIVLMGAGASYGSGETRPPVRPPLGNGADGLFARLDALGGVATTLPEHLEAVFREDFERGMVAYLEYSKGSTMAFQKEMAAYLAAF